MNFKERYQFDPKKDLLGKGGFSKVFRGYDTVRKRPVALKFFYGNWSDKYDVIGEINRMEDMVHPNLIRYYDATILESMNGIGELEKIQVGIMEYADAGDITILFKNKSESVIRGVIRDILKGLKYLHDNNIVHRDMKPKNILLTQKQDGLIAKIADFGISKKIGFEDKTASTQLLGSIEYMAPEQFNPSTYGIEGRVGTNIDLWSLGIIIYELFTQVTPFGNRSTGLSNEEILSNILFKNIVVQYNLLAEPYQTMVRRCLVKDANQRVQKADELLDLLENRIPLKDMQEKVDTNATQVLTKPTFNLPIEKPPVQEAPPIRQEPSIEKVQKLASQEQSQQAAPTRAPSKKVVEEVVSKIEESKEKKRPIGLPKSDQPNPVAAQSIRLGKDFFKQKNYVESYRQLHPHQQAMEFDPEAKFFLGFMLYNGKCGGAHDFGMGKMLMDEAKEEDRKLVMDLVVKYVLNRK